VHPGADDRIRDHLEDHGLSGLGQRDDEAALPIPMGETRSMIRAVGEASLASTSTAV
jgi:hypothetical protein